MAFLISDANENMGERFLVDEQFLVAATDKMSGSFVEPVKTTNVQNLALDD